MTFKVVMTDTIFPDTNIEDQVLSQIGTSITLLKTPEDIVKEGKDADALVVVYEKITKEIIDQLEQCKVIVRTGIGYNNIDLEAATEKGIIVVNVPDYCLDEVSDHAISLAFALLRKLHTYDQAVKRGEWSLDIGKPIFGFRGQTFGLVGFGNIPRMMARKLQAFGFHLIAYDPYVSEQVAKEHGVTLVSFEELLVTADIVSLHTPLVEATYHLMNDAAFELMKESAILINTSRGPIVDTRALIRALQNNKIAAAGIDVVENEPPTAVEWELLKMDQVIVTPHAAFYSEDSEIQLRKSALEAVVTVLKGDLPKHFVNKAVLDKLTN